MATEILPKYHCRQAELYPICALGWSIAKKHQADIAAKFTEYTITYINDKIARIATVEAMPDFQTRDSLTETERIILGQLATLAIGNWNLLERYIIRGLQSNKPLIKPNLEAAGSTYHRSATATEPNWEDLKKMLVSGKTYITDNASVISGSMYAAFPADYDTSKTNFEDKYLEFTTDEAEAPDGTNNKIKANNEIYDDLMLMLGDLKIVAPPTAQSEVTFTHLKGIISSPGPAGLKGKITEEGTGILLPGVLCRLLENGKETTTDAAALYDFGNFASGKFTLEFSLDGYVTLTVPVEIFTGVTSTKNFSLKKNP